MQFQNKRNEECALFLIRNDRRTFYISFIIKFYSRAIFRFLLLLSFILMQRALNRSSALNEWNQRKYESQSEKKVIIRSMFCFHCSNCAAVTFISILLSKLGEKRGSIKQIALSVRLYLSAIVYRFSPRSVLFRSCICVCVCVCVFCRVRINFDIMQLPYAVRLENVIMCYILS